MKNIIEKCKKYFADVLGIKVSISRYREINQLDIPYVIIDNYEFYTLQLLGNNYIIIHPKDEINITPATLYKQIKIVKQGSNKEAILLKSAINSFHRKRLIGYRIPFIVPGTQMYLPDLMIDMREHFSKIGLKKKHFSPATQSILIYMINNNDFGPFDVERLNIISGYSKATIRRSIQELENSGIGEVTKKKKNKILKISKTSNEIWNTVKNTLKNPVIREICLNHVPENILLPEAGLSALSHYTMISIPKNTTYAVWKDEWNKICKDSSISKLIEPEQTESNIKLQIWSYPPTLKVKRNIVDKHSLFLSLRNSEDERIEQALEDMLAEELNG